MALEISEGTVKNSMFRARRSLAKIIDNEVTARDLPYTVSIKEQRSHMNVTYRLPREELTDEFVKTATKQGMIGLKGYRTVGGIRASIYNAMPVEGCQALANFMKDFASKKS